MKEKQLAILNNMYSKYIKTPNFLQNEIDKININEGTPDWNERILNLVQDNFDGMVSTNEILNILKINPTDEVLDIGSGFGGISLAIARRMKKNADKATVRPQYGHVTGIEVQKDRCDFSKLFAKKLGVDDIVSYECDYFPETILNKNNYTKIVSVLAILHFVEKERTLRKIGTLLALGGTLVIEDYYTTSDKLSTKDQESLLKTISIPNLMTRERYINTLRESGIIIEETKSIDLTEKWKELCKKRVEYLNSKQRNMIKIYGFDKVMNHLEFCKGVYDLYDRGIIHGFRIVGTKNKQ